MPLGNPSSIRRRLLIIMLLPAVALPAVAHEPVYERYSIAELRTLMTRHALTSEQLTRYFIDRIDRYDRDGPRLKAVIELNPDALAIARARDADAAPRGPLQGIPVLIKDNIDTADRMLTTAGSLALLDSRPRRDAPLVARLRAAGAVILGKTNLSEWANFRGQHSISGWSARGGQTRNAYDPARSPCGSSAGSGAAIAAGFAVIAVGTETDGSIVCPASVNGIVGIKPTLGLVSRSGIVPIAASQDSAGPMARRVGDAALLLQVMAGADPQDAATQAMPPDAPATLTAAPLDLHGVRLGVVRNQTGYLPSVDAVFEAALVRLRAAGAVLVDVELKMPDTLDADETTVLEYEFKDGIARYLADRDGGPKSLAELIAFNTRNASRELAPFDQALFVESEARGDLNDAGYRAARDRAKQAAGRDGIDAVLRNHRLAALIAPTMAPAWLLDPVLGDHFIGGGVSQAPAIAGYPHVTLPAGVVHGMPVGLSFVGTAWSDAQLIALAAAFERIMPRLPPPALQRQGK
jgi:amidase